MQFSLSYSFSCVICPADSVPLSESRGNKESIQHSAQPAPADHQHDGGGAAAVERLSGTTEKGVQPAAGHQDATGTGDHRVQETAGWRT